MPPGGAVRFLVAALLWTATSAQATDVKPRLFSNLPLGTEVLILDLAYSEGDVAFDPSLPVEDVEGEIRAAAVGYVRALDVFGRSGSFSLVLPYADAGLKGLYFGEPASADRIGFGDPRIGISVNLFGAPALERGEFPGWQQKTIVGVGLEVTPPLGEYQREKLLNLGTNRWTFNPRIGVSRRFRNTILEVAGGAFVFTDNDEVQGSRTLEQDPLWYGRAVAVVELRNRWWLSGGYYYGWGGETELEGVPRDDRRSNGRVGFALSVPVVRGHRLQFRVTEGLTARIGSNFTTWAVGYQLQF